MPNPTTPEPGSGRPEPPTALARLVAHTAKWVIEYHSPGHWSAERQQGTAIRYLCAADMDELADAIDAAESRWTAANSGPDYRHPPAAPGEENTP